MWVLYWIKYPHHTDIYTEGYVGISKRPHKRFVEHKNRHPILKHTIKRGGYLELILDNLTEEEVLDWEKTLRPTPKIGWNITSGGGLPPSRLGQFQPSIPRTEEQKIKQSNTMKEKYKNGDIISWNKGKTGVMNNKGIKKCVYRGIEFTSMTSAAKYFGVSISSVSLYVKRENTCNRRDKEIIYKGVRYNNRKECSEITGNKYSSISSWVQRHPEVQP